MIKIIQFVLKKRTPYHMLQAFTLQLKNIKTYEYGQYEKSAKIRCKYNRQLPPKDCPWIMDRSHYPSTNSPRRQKTEISTSQKQCLK